jgi:hypothetical protein
MEQSTMMFDVLKLFAKLVLVITVVVTVFLYLLAIVLGPTLFYFTPEGLNASTSHYPVLPVWFLNKTVAIPISFDVGVMFLLLWIVFAVSFVAAWKLRENFHTVIRESVTKPTRKLFSSCLFALPIINSMTLIAVMAINSIQEAGGIPTGTPPIQGEAFIDFFELSYSAVVEEIGFRLIPIGAFLIIYLLITKKKEVTLSLKQKIKLSFTALLFPDKAKRMADAKTVSEYGVRGGISLGEWGMVIFTSIVFGLAHFNPGVSWEVGKISSAAVAGLVIGLSYIVYGAQAPIIMHWFFNVYIDTYSLFSELYPTVFPLANIILALALVLGILGWLAAATLGSLKLIRATEKTGNRQNQANSSLPVSPG